MEFVYDLKEKESDLPELSKAFITFVEDVVSILMLDEETLRNYVKRYQAGGINALITDDYFGSFSKLSSIKQR